MSKLIIGVDVDNVICNTSETVLKYYNKRADDNLTTEDIKTYYIEDYVKPNWKDGFYNIFLNKTIWKNINEIKDCRKYINKLIENDYRIIFVTSTEPYNYYKKSKWLSKLFPNINIRDSLICIKDKQLLSGNIDILIDDCPKNLSDIIDNYGNKLTANYKKIIFDYEGKYGWTKSFKVDNVDKFKAYSWEDVYKKIIGIER